MGRKNRHTNITDTIHSIQCIWGQRERPFLPKQHTFLTSTCLRQPLLPQSACAGHVWVHTHHKYRKTQGFTRSITCDWDTAGDICRTRATGMYHNTLPPQKKGSEHLHTKTIWHTPSISDLPPNSCSHLSSEVPKRNLQILLEHFPTWWIMFLALNPPSPYAMSSNTVSHIYQTSWVLIPWHQTLNLYPQEFLIPSWCL